MEHGGSVISDLNRWQGDRADRGREGFQPDKGIRRLYDNVIRMSPPLNIAKADMDEALRLLDESFAAVK